MNISKDTEDDQSRYELLLRFINPKIAIEAFDRIIEETNSDDEAFLEEVNQHTTQPLKSVDELDAMVERQHGDKIDVIERVE